LTDPSIRPEKGTTFKSQILSIQASNSDQPIATDGNYTSFPLQIRNLKNPIKFSIPFNSSIPSENGKEPSCHFFNTSSGNWTKLENKCGGNQTTSASTLNCCSDHATEFAVMDGDMDMMKKGALLGYALSICLGLSLFIV